MAKKHLKKAFHAVRLADPIAWVAVYKCLKKIEDRCEELKEQLNESDKGISRKVE